MAGITQWGSENSVRAGDTPTDSARFLIFGGSGLLGRSLCHWASAMNGYDIIATHLSSAPGADNGYQWLCCDITDGDAVYDIVERSRPTTVINAAYRQGGSDAYEICAIGAQNVARAATEFGARVTHISTDLVFDGTLGRPYRETDPVSPISEYGRAKARGEDLVLEVAPDALIVRTSIIYGEPTAPQEQLVQQAIRERDVSFFTDEWRSPVQVHSLADAVGRLARSSERGIIHVAGNERINRLQFATLLARHLGLDGDALVGRTQDPSLGPRPKDVSLNCSLSESLGLAIPGPTNILGQS
jgi:dTDP-4-dehydrorhamnose reductase